MTDAYLAAFNGGDIEAIRDIYADDVGFTLGNLPFSPEGQPITESYIGKQAAIDEHFQSIEANANITLSNTSGVGNAVQGRFSYTDDNFAAGNIEALTGAWETVAEGGKITSVTMTFDEETYQRWKAAFDLAAASVPIDYTEETIRKAVMDQLPGAEVECIRQDLGEAAFERFSLSRFSEDTSEAEEHALSRCLSNESLSRFFTGFALSAVGGLSDATIGCMNNAFERIQYAGGPLW